MIIADFLLTRETGEADRAVGVVEGAHYRRVPNRFRATTHLCTSVGPS